MVLAVCYAVLVIAAIGLLTLIVYARKTTTTLRKLRARDSHDVDTLGLIFNYQDFLDGKINLNEYLANRNSIIR